MGANPTVNMGGAILRPVSPKARAAVRSCRGCPVQSCGGASAEESRGDYLIPRPVFRESPAESRAQSVMESAGGDGKAVGRCDRARQLLFPACRKWRGRRKRSGPRRRRAGDGDRRPDFISRGRQHYYDARGLRGWCAKLRNGRPSSAALRPGRFVHKHHALVLSP